MSKHNRPVSLSDMMDDVDTVLARVRKEVERAMIKHRSYASSHEGWAVIKEELDELWNEVKADNGYTMEAFAQAEQVAATAVRYIVSLYPRMIQP